MARGTKQSNKTYFKIGYENNDKDNGQPFFGEQKKEGDKWVVIAQDTFLEGYVKELKKSSYEYKNKPQYTFELVLDGGDENYALQLNYGFFTRNILNSLATIEDLGATKIKLEIWRNKDGFVTVGVKNTTVNPDGERTEWLLQQDKLPKTDEPKWLGSFDYFIDIIKQRLELTQGVPTDDKIAELAESIDAIPSTDNDSEEVDDLPF